MSPDETIVTVASVVLGPVLWFAWLLRRSGLRTLRPERAGTGPLAGALALCTGLLFIVLKTWASFDVVDDPRYVFMYLVLGLAWLRLAALAFPFVGLSVRDDVLERGNGAALTTAIGGLVAVTLCYAGANIGNGPGWWVVVFSAALATGTLLLAWLALGQITGAADAVTIDRDPAAGLRLGAFLVASGLVLGRAVAGDWASAAATVADFLVVIPALVPMLIVAVVVERLARPTPQRPHAPFVPLGVAPATLYVVIALAALPLVD
jgi:hypothetical protein